MVEPRRSECTECEEDDSTCWDIIIDRLKDQVEDRHLDLLKSGLKVRAAAEEYLDGEEE